MEEVRMREMKEETTRVKNAQARIRSARVRLNN